MVRSASRTLAESAFGRLRNKVEQEQGGARMVKAAIKREQSQTRLSYVEREQARCKASMVRGER